MTVQLYLEVLTTYKVILVTKFGQVMLLINSLGLLVLKAVDNKLSFSYQQLSDNCGLYLQRRYLP